MAAMARGTAGQLRLTRRRGLCSDATIIFGVVGEGDRVVVPLKAMTALRHNSWLDNTVLRKLWVCRCRRRSKCRGDAVWENLLHMMFMRLRW